MKKKILLMIGFISIGVVGIFSATKYTSASASTFSDSSLIDKKYEENIELNYNKVEIGSKIYNIFSSNYNINDGYKDTYPSFFGGMYISDDSTRLIVQIVENNIPKMGTKDYEIYNEILNLDDSINIEYVNYSFNELNEINNNVGRYLTDISKGLLTTPLVAKDNKVSNIVGGYIDVINNTVVIEVIDDDQTQKDMIEKEIFKSNKSEIYNGNNKNNLVTFVKGEYMKSTSDVAAGSGYLYEPGNQNTRCTIGFRTKYKGQIGYITAGHCVKDRTNVDNGEVLLAHFSDGGVGDYGFVKMKSKYNLTNELKHPKNGVTKIKVIYACPKIIVNMIVAKDGWKTGYTSGKVTALNASMFSVNYFVTIKGLVKTNLTSEGGDSGAPVFIPKTDAEGGATPLGILSGGSKGIGPLFKDMYFTDLEHMNSDLVIGMY